ncbi:MAG: DMT family transporter [Anaerolineae bacterium]|nr:DMT family transporter [Anaerolineae bacterium]
MGEIAALVTAFCWALSSLLSSSASSAIGSMNVNRIRLILAVLYISLTNLALTGYLFPIHASPKSWFWLGLSGIVGLAIGDGFLYQSYVLIGVRLGTLIMSSVPVISTLIAWVFLGEHLSISKLAGIFITVFGIAIVVLERSPNGGSNKNTRRFIFGILAGIGGSTGQAVGLVLAKQGLTPDLPSYSGVVIRMLSALLILWLFTIITGKAKQTFEKTMADKQALLSILGASIVGPFIGVWLSLVSIRATYIGIASTLMALTPVILLPVMKWGYKEEISSRAVGGTLLAMFGVAVLFILA